MRISDTFTRAQPPLSFEVFPPKGNLTLDAARQVAAGLAGLAPDFISVTCSAGGIGNANATTAIAAMIEDEFSIPTMAHMTCMSLTEEHIVERIADLRGNRLENVLALRGDAVPGGDVADFRYAKDLVSRLAGEGFCVGAAAYPEGHIACESMRSNVEHLKEKQDAGASFFVTQLFFDNEYFYRFLDSARQAGVGLPITCGIMPFLSKSQVERMVFMCGASLPAPVIKLLAKYEHDPASLRQAGTEYAVRQLAGLRDAGADGFHIYTMNQPEIARAAVAELRGSAHAAPLRAAPAASGAVPLG